MSALDVIDGMEHQTSDRRSLLKRAASAGLVFPVLSAMHASETAAAPVSRTGVRTLAQTATVYDPFLAKVEPGPKTIEIVAKDATLMVAKDVSYSGWTFDGTIPGRAIRVVEGDEIDFTFSVDPDAVTAHSLDFHSAQTPPNVNYRTIAQGESLNWKFTPRYPGTFMYHCGTPPVLMHIGMGMYGAMIVDPKEGWSPAQELIFVQSEFYLRPGQTDAMEADYTKMLGNGTADYVVFNGYANQYVESPIAVNVGEPIRMFVVNCGPNVWSSFHVVGAIFDRAYVNGNPKNEMVGLQSITIGPGDGAVVEFTVEEPGTYVVVNHAFGHASQGAIAILDAQ